MDRNSGLSMRLLRSEYRGRSDSRSPLSPVGSEVGAEFENTEQELPKYLRL